MVVIIVLRYVKYPGFFAHYYHPLIKIKSLEPGPFFFRSRAMFYSFDIDVAKEYSVDEAIMIANFQHWIAKNKANNKHFHDGRYWTYSSTKAFTKLFPFWNQRHIELVITNLVNEGVLIKGNYNSTPYDRTCWYAFIDEKKWIYSEDKIDLQKTGNGKTENNQPIPDSKTDNIPDNKKEIIKERDDSLSNPDYYFTENFDLNQGNDVNLSSGSASTKDETEDCEPQTSDGGDPEIRSSLNEFVEKWNQRLCKDNKFAKKIIILSTVRKKSLRARLQETQKIRDNLAPNKNLLEFLFDDIVIPRIKQSPFLQGKVQPNTGYRKFEFNLEFFCRPSNFEKLINGFYKN